MHKFLIFIFGIKLYMFRTVSPSIIRSFSLYTQQLCQTGLLTACEQDQDGTGLVLLLTTDPSQFLLASCQQKCMTFTFAACTVKNSWWWTEELSETCWVLFQKWIGEISDLVGFIRRMHVWFYFVAVCCKFYGNKFFVFSSRIRLTTFKLECSLRMFIIHYPMSNLSKHDVFKIVVPSSSNYWVKQGISAA